jgi:hypothetical protein
MPIMPAIPTTGMDKRLTPEKVAINTYATSPKLAWGLPRLCV